MFDEVKNRNAVLERFKPIAGYDNYFISRSGTVVNSKTGFALNASRSSTGSMKIKLTKNGVQKNHQVNRLVAQAYLPDWDERYQVIPIDGDKTNNHVSNLRMSKSLKGRKWEG